MIVDIEERRHGPSDAMHNPSYQFKFSQQILVSFVMEIHMLSIDISLRDSLAAQEANYNARPIIGSENRYGDEEGDSNGGKYGNGNGGGNGNSNGGRNGNNGNGNRNGMKGGAGGNAPVARVCTYKDFLNCQPREFSRNEGVVRLLSLRLPGSKVALHSSSSSSSAFTPLAPRQTVPALPDLPRQSAILVLPGQEIPFGRPYRTHPNGAHMLLTARKRVHLFPARIPVNRRRFHSSSSLSPHKRCRVSTYSSSSAKHSSSPVFTGSSCKRCSVEVNTEMDIEDSIETEAEGDIKRDIEVSHEADNELDIDSDILADIEADIAAEAVAAIEADTAANTVVAVEADVELVDAEVDPVPSVGDTVEIAVDVVAESVVPNDLLVAIIRERLDEIEEVVHGMYEHLMDIPAHRLDDIQEEQRA
ncbi:hypothetical protein Tco_1029306 [Tanacetum coccineum]|uniref:Uncharacterized protein n=1 Tax=Tanacetum coccineum TaxID=301880 RepID=A0ABQ5G4G8_9ASTR